MEGSFFTMKATFHPFSFRLSDFPIEPFVTTFCSGHMQDNFEIKEISASGQQGKVFFDLCRDCPANAEVQANLPTCPT